MRRMHVSNTGWTVSVLGLLVAATGCGDSDGGASKSSGVPASKPAAEVTDSEAVELCEWIQEQGATIDPSEEEACTYVASSIAQNEADCKAFVQQCLDAPQEEPAPDDEEDCSTASASDLGGGTCTATVGEVESCFRDIIAAQKDAFDSASCAKAGMAAEPAMPASCTKLQTTCPGAFGDGSDDDGGGMSGGGDVSGTGGTDTGDNGGTSFEEFPCDGGASSYSEFDTCDGFADCADGADEADC